MSRAPAIVISPEAPYPMQGGGAIRTASLIHYLARDRDVDLILFRQAGDSDPARSLPKGLARHIDTITLPFHSRRAIPWIVRNARRLVLAAPPLLNRFSGHSAEMRAILQGRSYGLGLVEHFWCAPYLDQLGPVCRASVLDLHNVESALHASCARAERWPVSMAHRRFERAYVEREKYWLPKFSRLLVTSEEDAARIRKIAPESRVVVYPNALPSIAQPDAPEEDAIGFSANFEYHPNVTAVRYFLKEVWPALSLRFPFLRFRLIGKNPQRVERYAAGLARVEFTGPVENAMEEIAKLKVAVAPLLSGSGTRLKILEAWAAGSAVVSTSIGAEGLALRPGVDILIADSPAEMTESISRLLGSNELRHQISSAARQTFRENYTWEAVWRTLELD